MKLKIQQLTIPVILYYSLFFNNIYIMIVGPWVSGAHVGAHGRRGADWGASRPRHQRPLPGPRHRRPQAARIALILTRDRSGRPAAESRQTYIHALLAGTTLKLIQTIPYRTSKDFWTYLFCLICIAILLKKNYIAYKLWLTTFKIFLNVSFFFCNEISWIKNDIYMYVIVCQSYI